MRLHGKTILLGASARLLNSVQIDGGTQALNCYQSAEADEGSMTFYCRHRHDAAECGSKKR